MLFLFSLGLFLNRSANRAGTGAGAAIDAIVLIDNVLAVLFGDAAYGALVSASAAGDALIGNLVCHGVTILSRRPFTAPNFPYLAL
jgi:hypothetical protein